MKLCIEWHIGLFWQVDRLKAKLLEKLEQSLGDLQLKNDDISSALMRSNDSSKQENVPVSVSFIAHEVTE